MSDGCQPPEVIEEGEAQRVGRDDAGDVCEVAAPEGRYALLARDAREHVDDPAVLLVPADAGHQVRRLQQDLGALERRDAGLGEGRRGAAGRQLRAELAQLLRRRHRHARTPSS